MIVFEPSHDVMQPDGARFSSIVREKTIMGHAALVASIVWLAVLSPGADFAVVSRNSCLRGRSAGLAASAGIALACWFHVIYAIFGIAMVERVFPGVLDVIRVVGAAYLVYIGLSTAFGKVTPYDENIVAGRRSVATELTTGVLTNGLNPKTSIFVVSLYAQVIGRDTPLAYQLAWGLFISLSHLVWFAVVSVFLSQSRVRTVVIANGKIFNLAIGLFLSALGLVLLLMSH